MRGFDEQSGRLYQRVVGLKGMNTAAAPRGLTEGESRYAKNVRLSTGNVLPGKIAGAAAFANNPADEDPTHMFVYDLDTPWLIIMGVTKCWVQQTGNPAAKTPSTPFSSSTPAQWEGLTMLDSSGEPVVVVNNHGRNDPHYWDGGAGVFLPITAAPTMRCMVAYLGRLVGGDVTPASTEYLNRLQFSDYGDLTAWAGATSGDTDLTDAGDRIIRMARARGHQLLILREKSTYVGFPTLDPGDPIATQHLAQRGIFAYMSLQELENEFIFLGEDDVYLCDMVSVKRIGWKIRRTLFADADPSKLYLAWSYLDERAKDYYLIVEMSDGTQLAWIYNYEARDWSIQDLTGYTSLVTWRKD